MMSQAQAITLAYTNRPAQLLHCPLDLLQLHTCNTDFATALIASIATCWVFHSLSNSRKHTCSPYLYLCRSRYRQGQGTIRYNNSTHRFSSRELALVFFCFFFCCLLCCL